MVFNNDAAYNTKIYFLTKERQISLNEPSDILLSPEYYWIKRVQLPVTSRYEARKLAKSIFEDHLPDSEGYRFIVSSTNTKGSFIILAYHPDEIKKRLEKQIENPTKIRKIYFSQFAFSCTRSCIAIDTRSALQCVDGVILYTPVSCQERDTKSVEDVIRSMPKMHHFMRFYEDSDQVPESSVRQTILVLLLLFVVYGAEIGWYLFKKHEIDSKQQQIAKRYEMPATTMQYDSIVKRLEKTESEQRHKRRLLRIVSHLPVEGTFKLEKLSLSDDTLKLCWRQKDTKTEKTILEYLARNVSIRKISHKNGLSEVVIR